MGESGYRRRATVSLRSKRIGERDMNVAVAPLRYILFCLLPSAYSLSAYHLKRDKHGSKHCELPLEWWLVIHATSLHVTLLLLWYLVVLEGKEQAYMTNVLDKYCQNEDGIYEEGDALVCDEKVILYPGRKHIRNVTAMTVTTGFVNAACALVGFIWLVQPSNCLELPSLYTSSWVMLLSTPLSVLGNIILIRCRKCGTWMKPASRREMELQDVVVG